MNKKIIIDFDDTLVKSTKSIIEIHNQLTGEKVMEIKKWDGSDAFTNYPKHYIESLFKRYEFFDIVEFYDDAIETLLWLKKRGYSLEMCTRGHLENIALKIEFIKDNELDKIFDNFIFISPTSKDVGIGKEFLDAWIILDDVAENLNNHSEHNVLFEGDGRKEWNSDWNWERVHSWKGFKNFVLKLEELEK